MLSEWESMRKYSPAWTSEDGDCAWAVVCPEIPTKESAKTAVLGFLRDNGLYAEVNNPNGFGRVELLWCYWKDEETFHVVGSSDPRRRFQMWRLDIDGLYEENYEK